MLEEPYKLLLDLYARTPPLVQGAVLLLLIAGIFLLWSRKRSLKWALHEANLTIQERELHLEKARTQLADVQRTAARLEQENNELRGKAGGLEERVKTVEDNSGKLEKLLEYAEQDRRGLEERLQQIEKIDADIWCRSPANSFPPPLAPREGRRTVFVAVQNLKGGVGKTTLVANLTAAYATGVLGGTSASSRRGFGFPGNTEQLLRRGR